MSQGILDVEEVASLIEDGHTLLLAGEENLLRKLPQGKWIGGTIPYFITPEAGGIFSQDRIFVTDISEVTASVRLMTYDENTMGRVYTDSGNTGFSFAVIPAMSPVHAHFAVSGPNYRNFGIQPLVGWISGVHLDDLGEITPKAFDGMTGLAHDTRAVVMHVTLVQGKAVDVGIVNIFEQGDGDTLTFASDGFVCTDVMVNGLRENFADYIIRNKLDTKVPLVADYYGALINISFQSFEPGGAVKFYAPVFSGIRYRHAKKIQKYSTEFEAQLDKNEVDGKDVVFSCNCILNYLYSCLEGRKTEPFVGPVTFGEVAYQLLNQTLVYLKVFNV